ncbi:hypothetical protein ACIO1C_10540 [Streptomyces sp. NPDC087420]|uniref:hypothetical protein n=1 Tax=Streptomyces sp. NPDC087420 TaxID=3365785 RepID=UPI0038334901
MTTQKCNVSLPEQLTEIVPAEVETERRDLERRSDPSPAPPVQIVGVNPEIGVGDDTHQGANPRDARGPTIAGRPFLPHRAETVCIRRTCLLELRWFG